MNERKQLEKILEEASAKIMEHSEVFVSACVVVEDNKYKIVTACYGSPFYGHALAMQLTDYLERVIDGQDDDDDDEEDSETFMPA